MFRFVNSTFYFHVSFAHKGNSDDSTWEYLVWRCVFSHHIFKWLKGLHRRSDDGDSMHGEVSVNECRFAIIWLKQFFVCISSPLSFSSNIEKKIQFIHSFTMNFVHWVLPFKSKSTVVSSLKASYCGSNSLFIERVFKLDHDVSKLMEIQWKNNYK